MAINILLFILGACVGCGLGFFVACIGAARIIAENKDLKDELAQVKSERDHIIENNTQTIDIHDNRPETTGDYFKPF